MTDSAITQRLQELLRATPPFDVLPEEARSRLLPRFRLAYFRAGDVIFSQGSTGHRELFLVESGLVRLMDVERRQLLQKCGERELFGAFGLLKGGISLFEAKAVEPTVCVLLDGSILDQLIEEHDELESFFDRFVERYARWKTSFVDAGGAHLLFSRRLEELPLRPPPTCEPDETVQRAARLMTRHGENAVLVVRARRIAGIVTDHDLRRRFAARGLAPETPVKRLMSRPVVTIDADASLFDAVMTMMEKRVPRLVITRQQGNTTTPVGMLTDRDVAHFRGKDPLASVHRLDRAMTLSDLVPVREETNEQLQSLFEQGVPPEQLSRLMSSLYDRFAVRAIELVEASMRAAGSTARVDLGWSWLRVGSIGRREMALTDEHHSALLYATPSSEEEAERAALWFRTLAERVTETLARCGFPAGDIAASDPRYCLPLSGWRRQYRTWILEADRETVVHALRLFDLRALHGKAPLLDRLKEDVVDALNIQAMDQDRHFLRLVAEHALQRRNASGFLQRLVHPRSLLESNDAFDLRERALLPIVEAGRLLALELRFFDSANTFDRLRHAAEVVPELRDVIEQALDGYHQVIDLRLQYQLNLVEGGESPTNQIRLGTLTKQQQRQLEQAAEAAVALQNALLKRYKIRRRSRT